MNGWLIYDDEGYARNRWFVGRMLDSAVQNGLSLEFVPAKALTVGVRQGRAYASLYGREGDLPSYAICRTIDPMLSLMLEKVGVRVFNSAETSRICNDKALTYAFFSGEDIPMPDTDFWRRTRFDRGRLPAVFKSPDGHGGKEVFLVENPDDMQNAAKCVGNKDFLLQKIVRKGEDVRVYLLDGEILAAVRRTSETDFRSNFSLGGNVGLVKPCDAMRATVDAVYRKLHPFFVGVDFIFDDSGSPLLNEIEDVVGTRMLYKLTDVDVCDLDMKKLKKAL